MEGYGSRSAPTQALPPPVRGGAGAASLRGPIELLATRSAVRCFLGSLWLLNATNAAFIAAFRAFGEESLAAAVTKKLLMAAFLTAGTLFYSFVYVAVLLVLWRVWSRVRKTEAREEFAWAGLDCPLDGVGPVTNHIFIFLIMVMLLGLLMQALSPEKESCEGRVGSMLTEIGSFHCSVLFCSIVCRDIVIRLWAGRDKVKPGTARLR